MNKETGFTLVEVIAALVLVGILAALTGVGLVTGVKGYLFARENNVLAQKAQMALNRLNRELSMITNITSYTAAPGQIVYQNLTGAHVIGFIAADGELKLINGTTAPTTNTGDILIDQVSGFTVACYKDLATSTPWNGGENIKSLFFITITLSLQRNDGGPDQVFTTTINPRNTGIIAGPIGS